MRLSFGAGAAWRAVVLATVLATVGLTACADSVTAPRVAAGKPKMDVVITDWFSCASFDGGESWNCEFTGSTQTGEAQVTGPGDVYAPSNCTTDPTVCRNAYNGGTGIGSGTRPAPPTSTSMTGGINAYCLSNGLCSPDEDAAGAADVCTGSSLGDICTPSSPAPTPEAMAFMGNAPQLHGCPAGILTWTVHGTYNGEPVLYEVGVTRKNYLGAVLGFEEVAVYGMVIKFYAPDGSLKKFGGPAMVDCVANSYIGVGKSR